MKSIKSLLRKVTSWFGSLASPEGQKRLNKVLVTAYDLLDVALPVVETIAMITPTKADDEIVHLVKIYLPHINPPIGPITDEEKAGLIRAAAVAELAERVSDRTGIPNSTLNLAVELAYAAFKAAKGA